MLIGTTARPVAIVGGVRTPFARGDGAYAQVGNQELLTAALRGIVDRFGLRGERVDDVAAGAVSRHSNQWNLTREAVLDSGLAADTPAFDVQRTCATSLEAVVQLGNKIALGQIDCAIAGGVDAVSDPAVMFPRSFQQLLLRSFRTKSGIRRARLWLGLRMSHLRPVLPGLAEPRTGLSMGESTELLVQRWGIGRAEQDALAAESHRRASAAYAEGFYGDLVRGYLGLERDDNIRDDLSADELAKWVPAYDSSGLGSLTAGNSAPLTDGAAAVLLASEAWARERDLPVLGFLRCARAAAADHAGVREHLLMAPAFAVPRMLQNARLTLQDFDYYEMHEAFAGQVLCTLEAWNDEAFCREHLGSPARLGAVDRARLNVKGGSIAIGHPFAATGSRLVATLAKVLHENRARRGLICIGAAGGLGVTAIIER